MDKNNTSNNHYETGAEIKHSIPVVEEVVKLQTKEIDKGSIHLVKTVDEKTIQVPLTTRKQGYNIERVSIGKYVEEPPPAMRYEGNTMIVSVVEEETVIQKRLKIIEELHIRSTVEDTVNEQQVTLRKENVTVERSVKEQIKIN